MRTPNVDRVIETLERCFSIYGMPRQILTDHGSQFYATRGGISTFTMFCIENNIQHILASIRHPQTLGKVERKMCLVKEYLERYGYPEIRIPDSDLNNIVKEFVEYHNFSRPHFTYQYWTFGDITARRKVIFIPYLRYVTHRI